MGKSVDTSYCSFPKDGDEFEEVEIKGYDNLRELDRYIQGSICGMFTKDSRGENVLKMIVKKQ